MTDAPDKASAAAPQESDEATSSPAIDTFNPFARHVAMIRVTGMSVTTAEMRPSSPELFEPTVEPKVDEDFVDWEFLEKLKTWAGSLKQPHVKTEEELSSEITLALKNREEQFILRNLGRVEKYADPSKPIRLEADEARYGMFEETARAQIAEILDDESVSFIHKLGHEMLRERQAWMKWLRQGIAWERFFAKELKKDFPGSVWRRAPDGPSDPRSNFLAGTPTAPHTEQVDDGGSSAG